MKTRYYIAALIILSLFSLMIIGVRPAKGAEEPTPGVARVSLIHGDVTTMRGDSGDWVAATVNAPIVRGGRVATSDRSQTEIQLDYANVVRLAPRTEARVADLSRTNIQLQLAQGLLNYTVFKGNEADIEIDTPNVAVRPLEEGTYRIEVDGEQTRLIVRKGEAEVSTPQGSTIVKKNQLITIQGIDEPQYQIANAPRRDDWDQWNKERDSDISDARSWRYANRYYTGAHDLDRYGRWTYVPGYDWCWTPYVNFGWVPYRYGRWGWYPYWGWTWVSYEPWGWAPYHYGRWFWYGNSWCWWPGYTYYGYYPTWAPAYVSFIGFGFGGRRWHFGFGFGFGSIGWLPLGPYDYYYPWHGRHNTYNVVNITNITNVTNVTNVANGNRGRNRGNHPHGSNVQAVFNNPRVREAVTTVSTEDFVRGRVPRNHRAVDLETLKRGQVVRGTLPAVPTQESLRPSDKVVNVAAASARARGADNFFSRRQPPAGPRSFSEQAAEIQEMVQRHNPLEAAGRRPVSGRSDTVASAANNATAGATANPLRGARSAQGETAQPAGQGTQRSVGAGREVNPSNSATAQAAARPNNAPSATPSSAAAGPRAGALDAGPAATQATERAGWQRFGSRETAGSARPAPAAGGAEVAQRNSASEAPRGQTQTARPSQSSRQSGTQRVGSGSARPAPAQAAPQAGSRSAPAAAKPAPAVQPSERPGWQRFGTGRPLPRASTPVQSQQGASSGAQARPAPASRSSTSQPAPRGETESSAGGWRGFGRESRAAPSSRSRDAPAPRPDSSGGEQSGWRRFFPGAGQSSAKPSKEAKPAPRDSERPPLEIRKPIVTERPAPSRSFRGSGDRSMSAPSSSGRRWSTPSWGSRSAPAAPPRGIESGSRGRSVPSGGFGGQRGWSSRSGGSRGSSAPSGGSRGWSAPSGGGRSAPSASPRSSGGGGSRGGWSGGSRSHSASGGKRGSR